MTINYGSHYPNNLKKNMSTFKTQELKQKAIGAQQLVVDAAKTQSTINEAKAELAKIEAKEVVA